MIPGIVAAQLGEGTSGGGPVTPEDTVIDFVNGVYTFGGVSHPLSDVIDHTALVDAGGLEVPRFDLYAISLLSPFDAVPLTDGFTMVIEWENAGSLDSFVVLMSIQSDDLYANPGGNALYYFLNQSGTPQLQAEAWLDNGSTASANNNMSFAGGQPNDPSTIHKVASTWNGLALASSLDGQAVVHDNINFPFPNGLSQTKALIASEFSVSSDGGGVTFGTVTIRKIWFYATPAADSDLPTLSS